MSYNVAGSIVAIVAAVALTAVAFSTALLQQQSSACGRRSRQMQMILKNAIEGQTHHLWRNPCARQ